MEARDVTDNDLHEWMRTLEARLVKVENTLSNLVSQHIAEDRVAAALEKIRGDDITTIKQTLKEISLKVSESPRPLITEAGALKGVGVAVVGIAVAVVVWVGTLIQSNFRGPQ